jgi:hypothetical protein
LLPTLERGALSTMQVHGRLRIRIGATREAMPPPAVFRAAERRMLRLLEHVALKRGYGTCTAETSWSGAEEAG